MAYIPLNSGRFNYVKYDAKSIKDQQAAKNLVEQMEAFIETRLAKGRPASLALTALEEVYHWIGKAVRDDQVANRPTVSEEGRNDA
jgi:DNA-binding transcriptional regulator YhcF (GntR family)